MPFTYEYPRPAITVDCIILRKNKTTELLLIKRKFEPFADCWAFPGGFMDMNETLEQAAARELQEETLISNVELIEFNTFSDLDRDSRGRTITVVFYGLVDSKTKANANDDAKELAWFSIDNLPALAFDHQKIIDFFLKEKRSNL